MVVIGHRTQKVDNDTEVQYNTLALNNKRVKGYVMGELDVLAAVESSRDPSQPSIMHFRASKEWDAGARFGNIVPSIEFNYKNLVKAIHDAVEAEGGVITDEKTNYYEKEPGMEQAEFESLKTACESKARELIATDETRMEEILTVIDNVLGRKISECTINEAALLEVLKEELDSK